MREYWSRQTYPFIQSILSHLSTSRRRQSAKRHVAELQTAYADLLREHVRMWSHFVMPRAPVRSRAVEDHERDQVPALLGSAIRQILTHCQEALANLETEKRDGLEGHKAIGEILAYGRVTAILHRLQLRVEKQEDEEANSCGTRAAKERLTN